MVEPLADAAPAAFPERQRLRMSRRIDEVEKGAAQHLFRRIAEEIGHPLVDIGRLHLGIDGPDPLLGGLDDPAISFFAGLQCFLSPLTLGNIQYGPQEAEWLAVFVVNDLRLL